MQSRTRLRVASAVLFGLVTAMLTGLYLVGLSRTPRQESTEKVVVAARSIEADTTLTNEMLRLAAFPRSARLPGTLQAVSQAVGQRTVAPLAEGQPLFATQLIPPDQTGSGARVPVGMRLITVPVNELTTIGYRLRAGDLVDVVSVYTDEDGIHSVLATQQIQVFAVGAEGGKGEPRSVTLLTNPYDADLIALLATDNSLRLVLRASGDKTYVSPPPIDR